ncbi:MAG: aconitase X swivel domain-containing protein, partial [Candidatus Promineifilaceae bacterium]
ENEKLTWAARIMVDGRAEGRAMLLKEPLSLWGGLDPRTGQIIDERHPSLGRNVRGRVLLLPVGRGSSSASSILLESVRVGTAPAAIITSEPDGILTLGAIVSRTLYDQGPPVVVLALKDYEALSQIVESSPETNLRVAGGSVSII